MPEDLIVTLTDMMLGSPAVCIYRSNGSNVAYATSLAKVFVNYFNTTESTAIVDLAADQYHTKKADDNTHWQDVLLYCKDGCFQAMFDEYLHLRRDLSRSVFAKQCAICVDKQQKECYNNAVIDNDIII